MNGVIFVFQKKMFLYSSHAEALMKELRECPCCQDGFPILKVIHCCLCCFADLSHQVVHSNGKTETRTCDPVHGVEEAVPAEWSSLPRLALPLDQMSFPELRSAGSAIIRFYIV